MSSQQISATQGPGGERRCPICNAKLPSATARRCWLCHEELFPSETGIQTARGSEGPERFQLPRARGDAVAFVVFGVLAILMFLGAAIDAPGILIVLVILATPALIRTLIASSREQALGAPVSKMHTVLTFLSSLGIVYIVGFASVAAFYATCFVVCLGGMAVNQKAWEWVMVPSVGAGLVVGIGVAILLFRRLWPRKSVTT